MFVIMKSERGVGLTHTTNHPTPEMGPEEVRLRPTHAGICGTDMHIYQWDKWAQGRVKPPRVLGHEFVGVVEEVGSHVHHLQKGQRVSAECHVVCGVCRFCRTGQGHLCPDTSIIGVDRDGAFAQQVVVPATNTWPIADEIDNRHAAIFDPLGNAMHTVTAFPVAGKVVLVTGAGAIGLMAVAMARSLGAAEVIVSEPNAQKRDLAKELGATLCLDPTALNTADFEKEVLKHTGGTPPQVVLEMSGHEKALTLALDIVAPGGELALLGLPADKVTLALSETVIFKGLTLKGVIGRRMYDTWYQVDTFVRSNPQLVDKIISHTLPAVDYEKAFDLLKAGKANKIVLDLTTL